MTRVYVQGFEFIEDMDVDIEGLDFWQAYEILELSGVDKEVLDVYTNLQGKRVDVVECSYNSNNFGNGEVDCDPHVVFETLDKAEAEAFLSKQESEWGTFKGYIGTYGEIGSPLNTILWTAPDNADLQRLGKC